MASNRIGRINEEIRAELSDILRSVKDPRVSQAMVTITHVDTTSDLRYARIYVTALDRTGEKDLMRGLKSAAGFLRRELGSRLNLRYARVYVTALERTGEKDLMRGLKSAAGFLRRELGSRLNLRYTPELQFMSDDSIAHGAHILDLLSHVKPANPANADIVLPEDK